jgi:hypothetical protein
MWDVPNGADAIRLQFKKKLIERLKLPRVEPARLSGL